MEFDGNPTDLEGGQRSANGVDGAAPVRIGRYRIERLLGSGSFGAVYLASEDGPLARKIALKIVHPNASGPALDAALREARLLARLDNPSIARVLDAGTVGDGRAFLALEFIEGSNLGQWCLQSKPGIPERLQVLDDVAGAIAFAHERGTIHRDLKPANIMVREVAESRPTGVVLDFGVAAIVDSEAAVEGSNVVSSIEATISARRAGTLETMAPEQLILGALPSIRADIYSLGVLLYWSVVGRPPFARASAADILGFARRVQDEPVAPIGRSDLAEGVRLSRTQLRDLNAVLSRAMAKDPALRYASAAEFRGELMRLRLGQPTDATAPGFLARARRFVARNRAPVVAASVVFATLVAATAVVGEYAAREREARIESERSLERSTVLSEAMRGNLRALVGDFAALGNMPQMLAFWPKILTAYESVDGRDSMTLVPQRTMYAEQLTKAERAPEAIEQLQEALRVTSLHDEPEVAVAIRLRLGFALERAERVEEALAVIDGAIANDLPNLDQANVTNHPWFFRALRGRLLSRLGRVDEGVASIREAIVAQDRAIGGKGSLNDSQLRGVLISELIKANRIDEALAEGDALLTDIERNGTAATSAGVLAWRERTRTDLLRLRLERATDAEAPALAAELRAVAIEWRRLTGPSADKFIAINLTLEKRGFPPITEADALQAIERAQAN
jgi:tetratricopeptide (TPR) repeat protein